MTHRIRRELGYSQLLEAKLAVRTETREFERCVVRLAVDEDQIRAQMAIAKILPLARQLVIDMALQERPVRDEQINDLDQEGIEFLAKNP